MTQKKKSSKIQVRQTSSRAQRVAFFDTLKKLQPGSVFFDGDKFTKPSTPFTKNTLAARELGLVLDAYGRLLYEHD